MTRRIADLDVPLPALEQQVAALVAERRKHLTDEQATRAAARLRAFLAPSPNTTPKEAQR
ncbi:hypothetical protein AB0N99_30455 [Streptomyces sp. NPDC093272]|uniref:hypothetical protein n=1 Tax=Streptomyces sp. NPDC093272 TaxID=3154981 RepID=UPI0034224A8F